jgi:hypothetical protein
VLSAIGTVIDSSGARIKSGLVALSHVSIYSLRFSFIMVSDKRFVLPQFWSIFAEWRGILEMCFVYQTMQIQVKN